LKTLATDWTLGPGIGTDPYHIPIIRSQLTRNLGNFFSDLRDELVLAFEEIIPPTEGKLFTTNTSPMLSSLANLVDINCACRLADWTKVRVYDNALKIVSRTSNRIFVGAPLCMFSL
jgi:hypothetical protein